MGSLYRLFWVSLVRGAVAALGAYLVRWGFVEHSLMQDVASGVAFFVVDRAWEFWMLHRREVQAALYQRWLVLLGLSAAPYIQPSTIVAAAQERTREGRQP